jgi:hypothetical protein
MSRSPFRKTDGTDATAGAAGAVGAVGDTIDFAFLSPDDWARIRLDDETSRRADIDRLVDRLMRHNPQRDSAAPEVRAMLETRTRTAADGDGAVEMYFSFSQVEGVPRAAGLVVYLLPVPHRSTTRELLTSYVAGGRGSAEVVEHPTGPAARRIGTRHAPLTETVETENLNVQWMLPSPDGTTYALLSFSTPLVALAEPLGDLFDAVAESFHWVR